MARVVEIDPKEDPQNMRYLGRVKIRVLHDQTGELGKTVKTLGIKDSDLLWAWPISSIQSASLSYRKIAELEEFETPFWIDAVGTSPTGIAVGTYVFGFYLDGHEGNIPVIFGTYHKDSMYPEPPTEQGHEFLQIRGPDGPTFEYQDVSALAKGWHEDKKRDTALDGGIAQSLEMKNVTAPGKGGQTLPKHPYLIGPQQLVKQPPSDYDTLWPHNTVHTTKSGHAIELDDTPGHERIHWWHRSGSYEEVSNGPAATNRDGLEKPWPDAMGPVDWLEPANNHDPSAPKASWSGRRVRKTTESEYNFVLGNKETYVGSSLKLEIAKNSTTGIGGNKVETTANNAYIAIGYYPRTANNDLSGLSARYQLLDIYEKDADKRDGVNKLPDNNKFNFYIDVANNMATSVGYVWDNSRELKTKEEKNWFLDVANNCSVTANNNYYLAVGVGHEKEREKQDTDQTNFYTDVVNNLAITVGYNPDNYRVVTATDKTNFYTDVANNLAITVGYDPDNYRAVTTTDKTNFYTDVANNLAITVGYTADNYRDITADDNKNWFLDVANNCSIATKNNYYLGVGVDHTNERQKQSSDASSLFIDVVGDMATNVEKNSVTRIKGNHTHKVLGNSRMTVNYSLDMAAMSLNISTLTGTKFNSDVTVGSQNANYNLYVNGSLGTSKGASGSFTTPTGRTVTVVNGIVTSIV